MSSSQPAAPLIDDRIENPKTLRWAGAGLFALGLIALVVAFAQTETNARINMALYAALFLSLGYPLLMYSRALEKIAILEKRLRELEGRMG